MLPVGIGDEIRARRERAGLTQETLGALLGVHPNVIDDWEWGEGAPGPVEARRLAAILGLAEGPGGAGDPGASGDESITIHLVPLAVEVGRATRAASPPVETNLFPVPSHPDDPPPQPGEEAGEAMRPAAAAPAVSRQRGRAESAVLPPQGWFRRLVVGTVLALLVAVATSGGLAAYQQSQAAARSEAEARALRTTLVMLAGERDRLAARVAELAAALADSGLVVPGVPVSLDP